MLEKLMKIAEQICNQHGVALYDVEIKNTQKGKVVTIYITKIGGVSIDDCRNVSRDIDVELEVLDLIKGQFFLEVSSPGLERKLKKQTHFAGAINEKVKITYRKDDKNITLIGVLQEVLPNGINVLVDKDVININYDSIKKARTYFEIEKEQK